MAIPLIQKYRIAQYIFRQRKSGEKRYPLVLMLEPLFRCNLSCSGCGKINYPDEILDRRLGVGECLGAAEECGAPVVSVAGGETLIHREMPQITAGLVARKRFVYLCTNGVLLKSCLGDYEPSPYLTFSVHLDGHREIHDGLAGRPGVFDSAVEAVRLLKKKGFRFIVNCTIYNRMDAQSIAAFFDYINSLGAEGITLSPGYDFNGSARKGLFLGRQAGAELIKSVLRKGRGRKWRFNHSSLFLDFLAGNRNYQCTPWGTVTRNVLGWQRPCYLFADSYAGSYRELMDNTEWGRYGPDRNAHCANCMLHSGFEASAVDDAIDHPFKALFVYLRGPGASRALFH
ncbi:MAG: adenosyl-hopene transferase HpnH [Syntrophaceae bacterium]